MNDKKTIFKLWILDEVVDGNLDIQVAGDIITDESFENGIENWLDTYQFFTEKQIKYIKDFNNIT